MSDFETACPSEPRHVTFAHPSTTTYHDVITNGKLYRIRPDEPRETNARFVTDDDDIDSYLAASLQSHAEARRRACDLADGRGVLAPVWPQKAVDDVDPWPGVAISTNEVRLPTIIWSKTDALTFDDYADGFAS